jgi:hypothetical protein
MKVYATSSSDSNRRAGARLAEERDRLRDENSALREHLLNVLNVDDAKSASAA